MTRLNDTAALTGQALRDGDCVTREVRKIDNGFIVRTSSYSKAGDYKSSEKYVRESAEARGGDADDYGAAGCETLSDTKKYLGSDV